MISTNINTVVKWVILFLWVNFEVQRSFPPRKPPYSGRSLNGPFDRTIQGSFPWRKKVNKTQLFLTKNSSKIKKVPFAAKIWIKRDESTFVTHSWFESHTSNWIMGHWKVKRSFFMFFLVLFAGFSYSDILMWLHFSRYEFKMRYTE